MAGIMYLKSLLSSTINHLVETKKPEFCHNSKENSTKTKKFPLETQENNKKTKKESNFPFQDYKEFLQANKRSHELEIKRVHETYIEFTKHLHREHRQRELERQNNHIRPAPHTLLRKSALINQSFQGDLCLLNIFPNNELDGEWLINSESNEHSVYSAFVMEFGKVVPATIKVPNVWLNKADRFRNAKTHGYQTAMLLDDHNQMIRAEAWRGTIKRVVISLNGRQQEETNKTKYILCKEQLTTDNLGVQKPCELWSLNIDVQENEDYRYVGTFLHELSKSNLFPADTEFYLRMPLDTKQSVHNFMLGVLQYSHLTPCIKQTEWLGMANVKLKFGNKVVFDKLIKDMTTISSSSLGLSPTKHAEYLKLSTKCNERLQTIHQAYVESLAKLKQREEAATEYPQAKQICDIMRDYFFTKRYYGSVAIDDIDAYIAYRLEHGDLVIKNKPEVVISKEQRRQYLMKQPPLSEQQKQKIRDGWLVKYGTSIPPAFILTEEICYQMWGKFEIPGWIVDGLPWDPDEQRAI